MGADVWGRIDGEGITRVVEVIPAIAARVQLIGWEGGSAPGHLW